MIVLYHSGSKVVNVQGTQGFEGMRMSRALLEAARTHPEDVIVWCDTRLKDFLDLEKIPELMHHKRIMSSFNTTKDYFLSDLIGFCEEASPFIPVKRDVKYPTFRMSSQVGMVHAQVVNAFSRLLHGQDRFDYFLVSFAKLAMPAGLFCYSEPALLKSGYPELKLSQATTFELFKFVRQHYRMRWTSLVLLDMILFKRRFPVLPYLFSVFHSRRDADEKALSAITLQSSRKMVQTGDLDVVIPTIGRKPHLYNVFRDLAAQTRLPKRVIVVEQNPDPGSVSELDFITGEKWPFEIDHVFTHRTGACAARNVALIRTESEFVFMADDDIRFECDLIEKTFAYIDLTGNEILQVAGPQPNETIKNTQIVQHTALGSGLTFLKQKCLDGIWFNPGFEFGYGEDKDFGMQLRNKGFDVLLCPFVHVVHLKAPVGGFRAKTPLLWSNDAVTPKPSPTVMLHMVRNMLPEQVKGYKMVYFFKSYGKKNINIFKAYRNFRKRWERSVYWAIELGKR